MGGELMGSLLLRRREMMLAAVQPTPPTPILPTGYTQVEYIRHNAAGSYDKVASLNYQLNGTDTVEIRAGLRPINTQPSSSGGYIIGCRQTNTANTVGFGICCNQGITNVNCYNGTSNRIEPNNGASLLNTKIDIIVTSTAGTTTITDGVHSNSITGTPRTMSSTLYVFGIEQYNNTNAYVPFRGDIYYLNVKEAGTTVIDLIPCTRDADGEVGFYDMAQNRFVSLKFTPDHYVAGPAV